MRVFCRHFGTSSIFIFLSTCICSLPLGDAWTELRFRPQRGKTQQRQASWWLPLLASVTPEVVAESNLIPTAQINAVAYSGLREKEFRTIQQAVQDGIWNGIGLSVPCQAKNTIRLESTCSSSSTKKIIGTLGRLLVLETNLDQESIDIIHVAIAEELDSLLYSESSSSSSSQGLKQPVLIVLENPRLQLEDSVVKRIDADNANKVLSSYIERYVEEYEMIKLVAQATEHSFGTPPHLPTMHIELDGAMVGENNDQSGHRWWDTSSVVVFDDMVSDTLRKELLSVVLGTKKNGEDLDDIQNGPNPKRWVRGGLLDVPTISSNSDTHEEEDNPDTTDKNGVCWGLTDDAVHDLCYEHHDAIERFETKLSSIFPQFHVTRLPEAVFGSNVSPLTANAPVAGDSFDYHIDGDPNLTPPSPWTDIFGRYPNRTPGKPRFVSCLVYLNEEWDAKEWGAPTRFWDPPSQESYDVLPQPGRVVIMDQDVTHTVVAPNGAAGKRPRYSLVWKLVLHPKKENQDMTLRNSLIQWPQPILFGSARHEANLQ